jgi:hypothetical protein
MDLKGIGWERRLDSSGSRCGPVASFCEDGNESWGSVKGLISWIAVQRFRRNRPHGISYTVLQWILNHSVEPVHFLDSVWALRHWWRRTMSRSRAMHSFLLCQGFVTFFFNGPLCGLDEGHGPLLTIIFCNVILNYLLFLFLITDTTNTTVIYCMHL